MTAMLTCQDLVAGYGSTKVVRGIDLDLGGGSVLAVLGPNGAGKTTLMMTLAGLLPRLGGPGTPGGEGCPGAGPAGLFPPPAPGGRPARRPGAEPPRRPGRCWICSRRWRSGGW